MVEREEEVKGIRVAGGEYLVDAGVKAQARRKPGTKKIWGRVAMGTRGVL
jgi:hypothetical protein